MHVMGCGGASYIGSDVAKWLAARGEAATVLDNLSTGHREAVRWGELVLPAASSDKARRELGWVPHYAELVPIIESAWRWHGNPCF